MMLTRLISQYPWPLTTDLNYVCSLTIFFNKYTGQLSGDLWQFDRTQDEPHNLEIAKN